MNMINKQEYPSIHKGIENRSERGKGEGEEDVANKRSPRPVEVPVLVPVHLS